MVQSAVMVAPRERVGISLPLGLGLAAYLAGVASIKARLADPDVMLHIVTGRWILAHHAVPHADVLSFTMPGAPWVAHEWLGEVVTALLYGALGWHGLAAMAGLGLGAAVAVFARALLRYYRPAHAIIIAVAAWFMMTPHWLARPHIIALPLLVWWIALLVEARAANRVPSLAAAFIMVPWVNVHGTFLVGIGFAGLFTVEAVLTARGSAERVAAAKDWSVFTLAAMLAGLVTPNFLEAYLLPLRLLDMKFALSVLQEWKSINFQKISTLEIWLVLFLGIALVTGIRLSICRTLMVLLLFAMSLQHARNADLLAFIAPLLAGPEAGAQLARRAGRDVLARAGDWLDRLARPATARGLLLAGGIAVAGSAVASAFPFSLENQFRPVAAVQAALDAGLSGPVLNEYDYGDYLMFCGIRTFIDGRADMFGDDFLKRYYFATRGLSDQLPALLDEYHIAWTIFPKDSPAVIQLDRMPGWTR
ncbi:MAG TPA: hypothetical protein VFA22_04935, partial [Stellaceae bacterium]|nr:hypothetical protein [Stellaceae bacterium]